MRSWLKEVRIAQGLTQQDAADKCHITLRYYQYLEKGEKNPHIELAKQIAEVLNFEWALFYVE